MNAIKKVGFIIHMPREIDFYASLWEELQSTSFDILVDDYASEEHFEKILSILDLRRLEYRILSSVIKSRCRYSAVIATKDFQMRYRAYRPRYFNYKRDLGYRVPLDKKTMITRLILNYGLRNFVRKILRRPKFGSRIYRDWHLSNPDELSKTRIMFPRGIDLDDHEPEKCNDAFFTEYFCHGAFDEKVYSLKFKKPITLIGYPRYDYDNSSHNQSVNSRGSISRPRVLWMGSMHSSGLDLWAETLIEIASFTDFTYRPHPKSVRRDRESIEELRSHKLNINLNESENISNLIGRSDVVIAEWGDSVFSSIYKAKKTILVEIPEYGNPPDMHGLYEKVVDGVPVFSRARRGHAELIALLKLWISNPSYLEDNAEVLRLRSNLFGDWNRKPNAVEVISRYISV
jgi:hypothetical protein